MEIKIEIDSLNDINQAYKAAIEAYKGKKEEEPEVYCTDIWNGHIHLSGMDFESNYRRTTYTCIFQVSERT